MTSSLRRIRVPFLLVGAALLGACGGNTAGSAGSGGESTGGGGDGGTTSSTSTGGAGGAGTGGGSACSPECELPEVCEEGICKTYLELESIAQESALFEAGVVTKRWGQAQIGGRTHKKVPPEQDIAEGGGCVVEPFFLPEEWPYVPIEAGDLSVESPNVGLLPMSLSGMSYVTTYLADGMELQPGEGFAEGETVTLTVGEGAQFPQAQLQTVFPDAFTIQGDLVYEQGQPFHVQWTGPTPYRVFLTSSEDGVIRCVPTPGGSLTVPASVTQHLSSLFQLTVLAVVQNTTTLDLSPSRRISAITMRLAAYRTN